MSAISQSCRATDTFISFLLIGFVCLAGCGGPESGAGNDAGSTEATNTPTPGEPASLAPTAPNQEPSQPADAVDSEPTVPLPKDQPTEPAVAQPTSDDQNPSAETKPADSAPAGTTEPAAPAPAEPPAPTTGSDEEPSLDELLAKLQVPPPWLESVQTNYDTSHPWKDARLEIRRLLSLGKPETHREAIKLTWIYLQKGDIGDGHEYPMYTFMGGEPVWSVRAHEEFIAKPHENTPIHSYVTLASLYAQYGEFEKAKRCLDTAMSGLPDPPWRIMGQANLLAAYGDLYAKWGKIDEAKDYYAQAAAVYPTAKPPYGGHLLPRRAAAVQAKLDLLTLRSLATATLRDGHYSERALGYAGDIHVNLTIADGRIADIQIRHEEKIDQNACVTVPKQIIERQSLQVDAISGATVTKDAIIDGVFRALKKAGLE